VCEWWGGEWEGVGEAWEGVGVRRLLFEGGRVGIFFSL